MITNIIARIENRDIFIISIPNVIVQAFYISTGSNSGMPFTAVPFLGVLPKPVSLVGHTGLFIKPDNASMGADVIEYFGPVLKNDFARECETVEILRGFWKHLQLQPVMQFGIGKDIKFNEFLVRFGNLSCLIVSCIIGKGIWEEVNFSPLKKLILSRFYTERQKYPQSIEIKINRFKRLITDPSRLNEALIVAGAPIMPALINIEAYERNLLAGIGLGYTSSFATVDSAQMKVCSPKFMVEPETKPNPLVSRNSPLWDKGNICRICTAKPWKGRRHHCRHCGSFICQNCSIQHENNWYCKLCYET